jgi:2,4-diketo-3-deoxy-L-fuconate hydrolase
MRLCRILLSGSEPVPAVYTAEGTVIPLPWLYRAYLDGGYRDGPLFPEPSDDLLSYLPPRLEGLQLLRGLVSNAPQVREAPLAAESVTFLPPVRHVPKLICLAGNYAEHIRESGAVAVEKARTFPFFFLKPPSTTLRPSGSTIPLPANSPSHIDWEVELVVVVGTYAKCVSVAEARNVIAGYTVGLDLSNRRLRLNPQRAEQPRTAFHEWLCGKWHDGFAPVGPCIVPADGSIDPTNLRIRLTVNGLTMQDATTAQMIFDPYEIVSFASQIMTLEPGDLIMTGTPAGVGDARGVYLRPGDVVEGTIESIGTLRIVIR